MKNLVHGFILAIITFFVLVILVTTSGRMMREAEMKETLASAVDNAVENAIDTNTYEITDRNEFVADVMQNLAVQYHSTSEEISIAIEDANEETGSLFLTATATFKHPIGKKGKISYSKNCVYYNSMMDHEYEIAYMLEDGSPYKTYYAKGKDEFPVPDTDPVSEGKIFQCWTDEEGNICRRGESFPAEVTASKAFYAQFGDTSNPATGLSLTANTDKMSVGDKQHLIAAVLPENATNRSLVWSSSDAKVLKVDQRGNVTAVKEGEATITVSLADGSVPAAYCVITVSKISTFHVDADTVFVGTDDKARSINVTTESGRYIVGECSFASSNNAVVTVNAAGAMTPVGAGTAYITVAHKDSGASVSIPVMIVEAHGYEGTYDKNYHGITVKCPGAEITYYDSAAPAEGEDNRKPYQVASEEGIMVSAVPSYKNAGLYTVYYKVEFDNLVLDASEKVLINKADISLSVSSAEDTVTYPVAKNYQFDIEKEYQDQISITTSDENGLIALGIEGNNIKVTPGTKEGDATVHISIPETENYNMAQKDVLLHIQNGTMEADITVPYGGAYDGENHCIAVTPKEEYKDAVVTYALEEDGEYTEEQPEIVNAGTHTVYYKVELAGYKTLQGSKDVTIAKADGQLTFNKKILTLTPDDIGSLSIGTNLSDGIVTQVSPGNGLVTTEQMNTVFESETEGEKPVTLFSHYEVRPVAGKTGYTTLSFKSEASENYKEATCSVVVYVGEACGLFDVDGNRVVSWDDIVNGLGVDITKDYTAQSCLTDEESLYTNLKALKAQETYLNEYMDLSDVTFAELVIPASQPKAGAYAFAGLDRLGIRTVRLLKGFQYIDKTAFDGIEFPDVADSTLFGGSAATADSRISETYSRAQADIRQCGLLAIQSCRFFIS